MGCLSPLLRYPTDQDLLRIEVPRSAPLVGSVSRGWQGYRYEVDGTCYWNTTDWVDWDTDAAVPDPFSYQARPDQASRCCCIRARDLDTRAHPLHPVQGHRQGLPDFEYLRIIEAKG
jgi:hypothetical protein